MLLKACCSLRVDINLVHTANNIAEAFLRNIHIANFTYDVVHKELIIMKLQLPDHFINSWLTGNLTSQTLSYANIISLFMS